MDSPARKKSDLLWILAIAALLRLITAIYSTGFNHPDELFQVLEPAHGILYGYWYKTWEWERGIRCWFLAGVYAGLLKPFVIAGGHGLPRLDDPRNLSFIVRLITGLFSLVSVWAAYMLTLRFSGRPAARIAGAFLAGWWLFVYFSVRTLTEPIAMNLVMVSLILTLEAMDHRGRRSSLLSLAGGLLAGIAFAVRFQSGVFGLSFAAILVLKKRWPLAVYFSIGVLLMVAMVGVIDLATWGNFLHSPIEYFKFNVLEGGASREFGTAPWHRYLTGLGRYATVPLWPFVIFFGFYTLKDFRRTWPLWLTILPYWFLHQFIGHKEDRFLIPIMPFVVITAVTGWRSWIQTCHSKFQRWAKTAVLLLVLICNGYMYRHHEWNRHTDFVNDLSAVRNISDLRGLLISGHSVPLGGYFYLHRNVALKAYPNSAIFTYDAVPREFNYLLLYGDQSLILSKLKSRNVNCTSVEITTRAPLFRCE